MTRAGYKLEPGLKTMNALRFKFNKIKGMLTDMGVYQPVDDIHIITLVMCEEIQMRAFADVNENGTLVFVDKRKRIKQKNHSISTFYQMAKLIGEVSAKLGLSPLDRKELNLQTDEKDGFNDGE